MYLFQYPTKHLRKIEKYIFNGFWEWKANVKVLAQLHHKTITINT